LGGFERDIEVFSIILLWGARMNGAMAVVVFACNVVFSSPLDRLIRNNRVFAAKETGK